MFYARSHIGNIQPSGFLPLSAGNVRKDELLEVYRNSPLFRELRNPSLLKGKCGRCEFKTICGGSRARSYAMTGDYLGEEPRPIVVWNITRWMRKILNWFQNGQPLRTRGGVP